MKDDDSASSGESDNDSPFDRRALFEPVVKKVVGALGGYESGAYRLGDQALGCLKDLKKLLRKDDTDDERTVARIFWETRVLSNDLVPVLLETAGKGLVEDKRAIACADLITAMTWPIDLTEELKELDEELDHGTDYTQLLLSHRSYKAALLKPGVIRSLFGIVLPPLAKSPKERKERDGQIVNVVLHLFRNLAFIKDLPSNAFSSADQAEYTTLQGRFIQALSETHALDLLLAIATNVSNDPLLNGWNTVVLEIFYLLFRGVRPSSLATDQKKAHADNLHRLLSAENSTRRDLSKLSSTRHSRFGTTISVTLNPNKKKSQGSSEAANIPAQPFVLHRQQAINQEAGSVMDMVKQQKSRKGATVDELTTEDDLSIEARTILQSLAKKLLEGAFNPFLSSLLKDIRSERPKITEKDNLRLLFLTKWVLDFFLCIRAKEGHQIWALGLVAEVTDRSWIIWVLKRMRGAVDEKPKLWTELQAGIDCLVQLLSLIDVMVSSSDLGDEDIDAAEILQQQLVYNGEVLDISLESLKSYKDGTQTLAYLNSSVAFAYALLRMLEKWGKRKPGEVYVRRKKAKRNRKAKGAGGEDETAIPDVEEEEERSEGETNHEVMFTFEAFQMKFAHPEITRTLLTYLAGYKNFSSPDQMKCAINLLHRQAVKAKAEGLFFQASTLYLFKSILDDQKLLPVDQPYRDLINFVNYILRQFFKALQKESFLSIEAFFPKTRGHWKLYSSWEPDEKLKRGTRDIADDKIPPELQVKRGHSLSEQIGIVIAALTDNDEKELVQWTTDILERTISSRRRTIEEVDAKIANASNAEEELEKRFRGPSNEALAEIRDYEIPCNTEEQLVAATKNPQLKLLFRLCDFKISNENTDGPQWYIPSALLPDDLQNTLGVIRQYLSSPIDLDGKKASTLLRAKTKRRRRRSPSPDSDAEDSEGSRGRSRKEKRKKEKEVYKSAAVIVDSDEEYGDMDAFLEKERLLRERTERITSEGGRLATMKATGTKKRKLVVSG